MMQARKGLSGCPWVKPSNWKKWCHWQMGSKNQQTTVVGAVNADIKEGEELGKCVQRALC
jgi:hypothetical protein